MLQADAAVENLLIHEMNRTWFDRFQRWIRHDWRLADRFIELNDRPGLGITVHEEHLARCRYDRPMAFRHYRYVDGSWKGW